MAITTISVISYLKYKVRSLEDIFDDFEVVTDQEWREKIEKDIKGDFQDLLWQDENKLVFQPFYRKSDLEQLKNLEEFQSVNNSNPDWKITQLLEWNAEDENTCLNSLKKALESGADSILLKNKTELDKLAAFLKKNLLDHAEILIEQNSETLQNLPLQIQNANILLDPISDSICKGNKIDLKSSILGKSSKSFFEKENLKLLVDSSTYKNAGCNHVQELAFLLQHTVEYLDFFTEQGIDAKSIADKMVLKVGIGTSHFSEIAKIRALRFLWNKLLSAYKIESKPIIIAETSSYYLSVVEPYNNLLRATTQVMSAAFANCNFITSPSFDLSNKASRDFSDRMARNIQIILKEESYANKVEDPAAGSYYVETMSEKMADAAWEKFLKIEEADGLKVVYEEGELQKEIKIVHEKRLEDMKEGKFKLLGVNIHNEANATTPELAEKNVSNGAFTPLEEKNLSEEYLRKEEKK